MILPNITFKNPKRPWVEGKKIRWVRRALEEVESDC